jgi:hypothetical protein
MFDVPISTTTPFWSSSESNSGSAWPCRFSDGYLLYGNKTGGYMVRPVAFYTFAV